ncbi:hypothetical protein [Bradyrhizobium lablabi]|uniref:hypothetical protein n=1 Tax=Bradyrhizobium lablabi TaxID=722472 RepID=UPI0012ABBC89|nr:hypothetical protein [Bradyrhizobium lablabi]
MPVNKNNKNLMPGWPDFAFSVEASPMATNHLIPLFLSDHTEESEQPGIGKAWDRAAISSRILKTSILVVTAAAIVFAILFVGNPLVHFASATASLVATSAPQDGTGQSMPIIQSTAGAQALLPTAREAPTGDEIAAAFKTAYQSQTEIRQPSPEALFKQFQAWAAEEDARAQIRPVQPVQDARAQVVQNARAQVRPAQKHRQVRPKQNARAQVRPEQNARAQVRPEQNAQAPWPVQSTGWLD